MKKQQISNFFSSYEEALNYRNKLIKNIEDTTKKIGDLLCQMRNMQKEINIANFYLKENGK